MRSKNVHNYNYKIEEFTSIELEVASYLLDLNSTSPEKEETFPALLPNPALPEKEETFRGLPLLNPILLENEKTVPALPLFNPTFPEKQERLDIPKWGCKGRRTAIDVSPPSSPKPLQVQPALYRIRRLEKVHEKIGLCSLSLSPKTPFLFPENGFANNNLVVGEKEKPVESAVEKKVRRLDKDNIPMVTQETTLTMGPTPTIAAAVPPVDSINNHSTAHIHRNSQYAKVNHPTVHSFQISQYGTVSHPMAHQNFQYGRTNLFLDYNKSHYEKG